jgi:hypothetical protein
VPAPLTPRLIDRDYVQVEAAAEAGDAADAFGGWTAVLQVRRQTRAELDARLRAIRSDFMGRTRVRVETRAARFGERAAEEVCALVWRTPGHDTLLDGTHRPMPEIVELVHGFLIPLGDQTLGALYRLPPQAIADQPRWEQLLASLAIAPAVAAPPTVEQIIVFQKSVAAARADAILKQLGWPFHSGSDSSRGKKYFYDHDPQFSVQVPADELPRFRARVKQQPEIFETHPADRSVQKD